MSMQTILMYEEAIRARDKEDWRTAGDALAPNTVVDRSI